MTIANHDRGAAVTTSVETVTRIQAALGRGQIIEVMADFAPDVRWSVNCTDHGVAPWFGEYRGRPGVLAFFEAMSQVEMSSFEVKAVVGNEDVVAVLIHMSFVVPSGRTVDMDEAQLWTFKDAKVQSVELFPDTLAVARALG